MIVGTKQVLCFTSCCMCDDVKKPLMTTEGGWRFFFVYERRKEIESGGATASKVDTKEESFAIDLMKRIRLFIKRYLSKSDRGPSTAQILAEFNDVKDSDAVLFKSILKQVAVVSSGRWELR